MPVTQGNDVATSRHGPPRSAVAAERLAGLPPVREVVPNDPQLSARWRTHGVPSPVARWNYHPEYEVHLIRSGTGRYIVGDRIDIFAAGQLVLVGPNVPHHWISDLEPGQVIPDRDVVFQFHPRWITQCQRVMPELVELNPMLVQSARGIEFTGRTAAEGARQIELIGAASGPERLHHIFGLLATLSAAPAAEHRTLAKVWLPPQGDQCVADRVERVFEYVLDNLVGDVRLSVAANMVGMSDSAFSRYFKRSCGQTFSETVRKLRLAHACKLLQQSTLPVSSIYSQVGYSNISNFNRQFRAQYAMTPTMYRRRTG